MPEQTVLWVRRVAHCQYWRQSAMNRACACPEHFGQTNPAGRRDRSGACSHRASVPHSAALDKLARQHTVLKLELVLRHRWRSVGRLAHQCAPRAGSGAEPASSGVEVITENRRG